MRDFSNRVAVVTGAASGIGAELALHLAREGADLALADIDPEGMQRAADRVAELGRKVSTHRVDVSDRRLMELLPEEVMEAHGRIDVLINNAGVSVGASLEEHELEDFEWVVGINLWGVVYGCKFFLPYLKQSDDAYIVNLSSVFGLVGVPRQTSYCATKFAVRGLSESLGGELAGTSVRVLSVHPGGIKTNIVKKSRYRGKSLDSRDRVIKWFEKRAMPPEKAADIIVGAMKRGAERVLVAPEAYGIDVIKRLVPVIPGRVLAWLEGRMMRAG